MQSILDQIRAEIAATEERLEKLRAAEEALSGIDKPSQAAILGNALSEIAHDKPVLATGSITAAIQAQLGESGSMTKANLEKTLGASRSLGKQSVSAALQAMKRRGTVKLMKGGKWKLL